MRSIVGSTLVVVLLIAPLRCYAQPPVPQSNSSQQPAAKAKNLAPPKVEIVLRNGKKLKGQSYGRVCNPDCYNCREDCYRCRVEIVQKGVTQTIQCRDIQRIDPQRTFWQKVGHVTTNAVGVVLFVPGMLLIMIFCRKDCEL